jgi:hypothetical protein
MTRARTRAGVILCAAVVSVAGCSRSGSDADELSETVPLPNGISACDEVFGPGKVVDPATFGEACSQGEELVVPRPVELHCSDQSVLFWNDFAWGYEGQEMTMLESDTPEPQQSLPYEEAVNCLKDTALDQQAALERMVQPVVDGGFDSYE